MKFHNAVYAVIAAIVLTGCQADNPQPTPTTPAPSATQTTKPSEAPTVRPEPTRTNDPEPGPKPEPDPTRNPEPKPSITEAGTPATQFASRWGKRYPDVPEFAILKAANGTCRAIEAAGPNWNDNALVMAAIEAVVTGAGLSGNDALEFAQDAKQNYCSSVANPT